MATTVTVVSGVPAVPGVVPRPVVVLPAVVTASVAAVSGVLAVPGVSPIVVVISRVISASDLIGSTSQVPGVGVGEVALSGVLVVVHPGWDLRHWDRNDLRLENGMRVDAANVLVMLLAGLSKILSVSLSPLVPRVEVPGSVNAFWVAILISETGLLKSLGQTGELERSVKPGLDAFRFRRSSQTQLDGQLLPLLLSPA